MSIWVIAMLSAMLLWQLTPTSQGERLEYKEIIKQEINNNLIKLAESSKIRKEWSHLRKYTDDVEQKLNSNLKLNDILRLFFASSDSLSKYGPESGLDQEELIGVLNKEEHKLYVFKSMDGIRKYSININGENYKLTNGSIKLPKKVNKSNIKINLEDHRGKTEKKLHWNLISGDECIDL